MHAPKVPRCLRLVGVHVGLVATLVAGWACAEELTPRASAGAPRAVEIALLPRALRANGRVTAAAIARRSVVRAAFEAASLPYPPDSLLLRGFKRTLGARSASPRLHLGEGTLELWGARRGGAHRLVRSYPICAASGVLGPKRRQGDLQVPEGFYRVVIQNPFSAYHLSLGLDYPNASDRRLRPTSDPGGQIMIHGNCVSIGCVALGDRAIEEVYLAVAETTSRRGRPVPVHVFPTRLDESGMRWLGSSYRDQPELLAFWRTLRPGFEHFERLRLIPRSRIDRAGRYQLEPSSTEARASR